MERQGVALDFSMSPLSNGTAPPSRLMAGEPAIVTLRVTDARTGQPLAGVWPKAWMSARLSEHVASEVECHDKVRGFMAGQLATRADVDLNAYVLLTLNHDKTLSVINPQVSFNATKLENLISLPGNGADWVLSQDKNFLYVTLPDEAAVAVVDTTTRQLVRTLDTGAQSMPRRIALQPDGRYAWVGLDGDARVLVIDTARQQVAARLPSGAGLHAIAFTPDSRLAYVANSTSNTVTAIDVSTLTNVADIAVGPTPTALAYGTASTLLYVASLNSSTISVIDPARQHVVATVPVRPGVVALDFEPQGRFALALNQLESTVSVIDSATHAVVASTAVVTEPDQVRFSARYAYIRGLGSEKFSLLELSTLRQGQLAPVDIQAGRLPPSAAPQAIGVIAMMAPTPTGNAMLIANTPDRTLYFYQEGMMAPTGAFSNYKRLPRGLLLLDRSLSETAPGVYSTSVILRKGGRFDVPVVLDQPRLVHCFQVTVDEAPGVIKAPAGAAIHVEALVPTTPIAPGTAATLRFKITDAVTKHAVTGLADVQALVFEPPGVWQQRRSVKEAGDGVYAFEQVFPHAGVYNIMLAVPSRGVHLANARPYPVTVMAAGKGAVGDTRNHVGGQGK
jgi:YVTN family beta-propeller protein